MIKGSGIKGKLRATAEGEGLQDLDVIFGSSRDIKDSAKSGTQTGSSAAQQDYAGALIAGDARILLFPVRSLNGIFAYTTSYDVLQRFARDLERSRVPFQNSWSVPKPVDEQDAELPTALVTSPSDLTIQEPQSQEKTIVLEEFSFKAQEVPNQEHPDKDGPVNKIAKWLAENAIPRYGTGSESMYWQDKLKRPLVNLPNHEFWQFAPNGPQDMTRTHIAQETKKKQSRAP